VEKADKVVQNQATIKPAVSNNNLQQKYANVMTAAFTCTDPL
jgi:hypothetical protein